MSNCYIHTLFPIPVFETILDSPSVLKELGDILLGVDAGRYDIRKKEGDNLISTDSFVLDQWDMEDTKEEILKSLSKFIEILSFKCDEILITQSWLNVNPYLTSHSVHFHKNSVLSGVLYLNTGENCGDIRFHKEEILIEPEIEFDSENEFSWSYRYFTPVNNQLLIFPSHLKHSVSQNLNKNVKRVSLSFNTTLSHLGSKDSRTFLSTKN
jgi:uncharacterized protein (TIGR02466 family)